MPALIRQRAKFWLRTHQLIRSVANAMFWIAGGLHGINSWWMRKTIAVQSASFIPLNRAAALARQLPESRLEKALTSLWERDMDLFMREGYHVQRIATLHRRAFLWLGFSCGSAIVAFAGAYWLKGVLWPASILAGLFAVGSTGCIYRAGRHVKQHAKVCEQIAQRPVPSNVEELFTGPRNPPPPHRPAA